MKAFVYTQYGSPEVLQQREVAKPLPQEGEVLIKVAATTVTTGDVNMRGFVFVPAGLKYLPRLMFGLTKPKKRILGMTVAGTVVDVGAKVREFKVGDEVFGMDSGAMGAYAEYACRPTAGALVLKPANISAEEATAVPFGGLTALYFLRDKGHIQAGQKILVRGASGGVGVYAVQLASYFGAEVTAVCSTKNIDLVTSLGAHQVIDYTQQDFTQNGATYDLIFDTVASGTSFDKVKNSLTAHGRYLAVAGGLREMIQTGTTALRNGPKVITGAGAEKKEDLAFLSDLLATGHLKPVIDRCYPFDQMVEAHRYVDTGRKRGSVVISLNGYTPKTS